MLTTARDYLLFSLSTLPIVLLGWIQLAKSGSLYLYEFWDRKFVLDKLFFVLLFLQFLLSGLSWFSYEVRFYDEPETVYISAKWNFFFILITMLNFFFLGFWKSSWIRIWFFSTQLIMIILCIWGYLEPNRYFFDLINVKEISYNSFFYVFAALTLATFSIGYFTFKEEDRILESE